MDIKHEALLRDLVRDVQCVVVGSSRGPVLIDPKYTVIIGTSGSTDYLRDTTGNQRFWPVSVVSVPRGRSAPGDGQRCDGLHDENAPVYYLCSRCFPDHRTDLFEYDDDEVHRDEPEEME